MANGRYRIRQRHNVVQEPQPAAGAESRPRYRRGFAPLPRRSRFRRRPHAPRGRSSGPRYSTRAMPAKTAVATTAPVGTVRIQSSPSRARSSRSMASPG